MIIYGHGERGPPCYGFAACRRAAHLPAGEGYDCQRGAFEMRDRIRVVDFDDIDGSVELDQPVEVEIDRQLPSSFQN